MTIWIPAKRKILQNTCFCANIREKSGLLNYFSYVSNFPFTKICQNCPRHNVGLCSLRGKMERLKKSVWRTGGSVGISRSRLCTVAAAAGFAFGGDLPPWNPTFTDLRRWTHCDQTHSVSDFQIRRLWEAASEEEQPRRRSSLGGEAATKILFNLYVGISSHCNNGLTRWKRTNVKNSDKRWRSNSGCIIMEHRNTKFEDSHNFSSSLFWECWQVKSRNWWGCQSGDLQRAS